jgi:hypothetical protein
VILLASSGTTIVVVSVLGGLVFLVTTVLIILVFLAVFPGGEESANDVEHFIELTEEARSLLPNGHAADTIDDSSTAIARFQAKKDEARRALWESRRQRAA